MRASGCSSASSTRSTNTRLTQRSGSLSCRGTQLLLPLVCCHVTSGTQVCSAHHYRWFHHNRKKEPPWRLQTSPPPRRPGALGDEEGRRRVQPSRHRSDERWASSRHDCPRDRKRQADLRTGGACCCAGKHVSRLPQRPSSHRPLPDPIRRWGLDDSGLQDHGNLQWQDGSTRRSNDPGTGKSFELDFSRTAKWEGELLLEEHVFWDSTLMAEQIGIAQAEAPMAPGK